MEIVLMCVGRTGSGFISTGLEEYMRRLERYVPFRLTELPETRAADRGHQKTAEGKLFLGKLQPSDYVILLDERGKEYTSEGFAAQLQKRLASGRKRLVLCIGGPYGFSQEMYDRADGMVALSKMTFTHDMARLFATEQIYRAMTILRGEPYHHSG